MTFLFFILFAILILGVMFILSVVRGVSSLFFGKQSSGTGYASQNRTRNRNSSFGNTEYSTPNSHKKVFSKDEGEYVSYEEIKE